MKNGKSVIRRSDLSQLEMDVQCGTGVVLAIISERAVELDTERDVKLWTRLLGSGKASVLSQKLAKEVGGIPTVMPAKAGIQKHLIILDSGSR